VNASKPYRHRSGKRDPQICVSTLHGNISRYRSKAVVRSAQGRNWKPRTWPRKPHHRDPGQQGALPFPDAAHDLVQLQSADAAGGYTYRSFHCGRARMTWPNQHTGILIAGPAKRLNRGDTPALRKNRSPYGTSCKTGRAMEPRSRRIDQFELLPFFIPCHRCQSPQNGNAHGNFRWRR